MGGKEEEEEERERTAGVMWVLLCLVLLVGVLS